MEKTAKIERAKNKPIRKVGDLLFGKITVDGVEKWMMQGLNRSRTMYAPGLILTMNELSGLYRNLDILENLDTGGSKGIGGRSWVRAVESDKNLRIQKRSNGSIYSVEVNIYELREMFDSALSGKYLRESVRDFKELS